MTNYDKEEYQQFLRYIKCTWGTLLENDWINEPKIKKIIIDLYKNKFTVCVCLEKNSYYKYENKELIIKEYDPSKYIKTTYTIGDDIMLYMLTKGNIIKDLELNDVDISINPTWISYVPVDEYLSKELEKEEESYAECMYCIAHDL